MGIKQNIRSVIAQATADGSETICNEISYSAVKAILNGIESPEWRQYMQYFAKTSAELDRLTFADQLSRADPDLKQNIVYVVAYATCTSITLKNMSGAVDDVIESGL